MSEWCEISHGCGVWLSKQAAPNGVVVFVSNRGITPATINVDFRGSENVIPEVITMHLPGMVQKEVCQLKAIDPSRRMRCFMNASCSVPRGESPLPVITPVPMMSYGSPSFGSPGPYSYPPMERVRSTKTSAWVEKQRSPQRRSASPPARITKSFSPNSMNGKSKKNMSSSPTQKSTLRDASVQTQVDAILNSPTSSGTPGIRPNGFNSPPSLNTPTRDRTPSVSVRRFSVSGDDLANYKVVPQPALSPSPSPSPPQKAMESLLPIKSEDSLLSRVPVEPNSLVEVLTYRLGETTIGFEAVNNSGLDGQILIDFTQAKNCKIISTSHETSGKEIRVRLSKRAITSICVALREAEGLWTWDHKIQWHPHTGRSETQHHLIGPGVDLMKDEGDGNTDWIFSLLNTNKDPISLTIDFTGSSNAQILPFGDAMFCDNTEQKLTATVPPNRQRKRICAVSCKNPSKGWSWSYKTAYYSIAVTPDTTLPVKMSIMELPGLTGVDLQLLKFDSTQTHCILRNHRQRQHTVKITFSRTHKITYLQSQSVVKEKHFTFTATCPSNSKVPLAVAVCSNDELPSVALASVIPTL